jgi:cyclic pyranopterin phosphate synthase
MKKGEKGHLDDEGRARMVDTSGKEVTLRKASASARIRMSFETLEAIREGLVKKGDVLAVAQVAGVMAAKKTPGLIPMCHPLELSSVNLSFETAEEASGACLEIKGEVTCVCRTGVEMEALTAVTVAALTVYDMCKSIDRWMTIEEVRLLEKSGGRSGHVRRE